MKEMIKENTIHLKDGRTLAYTEHGDLSGKPLLFFHGNPGSRLICHPDQSIAQGLGIRIITPDRPGFGLSDYQKNRTLLDYPDDMGELADSLGLDTFAVCGISAGGPYAAACAYKLPERVKKASIISGISPINRKGCYEGMHLLWRITFVMSKVLPFKLLQPIVWIQTRKILKKPDELIEQFASILSDSDKEVLARPEIRKNFIENQTEAIRHGVKGWTHESKIVVSPWGFQLEDIQIPVSLWYWEDDLIIPPQMGRYIESKIPHCDAHFLLKGGHLSIFDHFEEILQSSTK